MYNNQQQVLNSKKNAGDVESDEDYWRNIIFNLWV
jgi:hypothetical protein